jgi:hypothetical protein
MDRFRALVAPSVTWSFEVPIGPIGDRRAWDAFMIVDGVRIAVEAETRPRDVQVLQRRVAMKRRDDRRPASVVLLMKDSRYNRTLLSEQGEVLSADLPMPGSAILQALAAGKVPEGSGIVLL